MPSIEQGLADLATWVEKGIPPAETSYSFSDGKVSLPAGAAERGGTQPVVRVTAEGKACLEASVGQHVTLRSEEHTSELQSLMRISYAVFCLKKKKQQ